MCLETSSDKKSLSPPLDCYPLGKKSRPWFGNKLKVIYAIPSMHMSTATSLLLHCKKLLSEMLQCSTVITFEKA